MAHPEAAADSHLRKSAWRWLQARWVSPAWVDEAFERQRRIDPFGHRVHTWMAAIACLMLGAPNTFAEIGAIPVMAAFLIRMHRHWRTWPRLFLQPLMFVVLAWAALGLASRLWTAGSPAAWLDEFGVARFGFLAVAIWPVADRRALLLAAIAAGFAVGQGSQVLHAAGAALEVGWMTWNRLPGRNSGWWDPVVGGSLLTAVLGLHLPAAIWGRGVRRVLGAAGSGATLLGILATGTRGAWLAAAGLIFITLVAGAWRVRNRRRLLKPALAGVGVLAVTALAGWLVMGDSLQARFEAGRTEVAGALERREFQTDTGARVLMGWWALEALGANPAGGVGMGGYEAWTRAHVADQGIDPGTRNFHSHAHNALLHAGAALGAPGLLLAVAFAALAISGAATRQPGDGPPGYADGPCLALVGLLLVSAFDSVQVNAHTAQLLAALIVFAVQQRPAPAVIAAPTRRG